MKFEGRLSSYQANKLSSQRGVIALPSIILISLLVLVAGIGIASSGFFENIMSAGDRDSKKALTVAETGAEDAFIRVVRNKRCNEGGTPACSSYTLTLTDGTSTITVTGTNPKTIIAQGTVGNKTRKVQVDVSFDGNNKATSTAWVEITN